MRGSHWMSRCSFRSRRFSLWSTISKLPSKLSFSFLCWLTFFSFFSFYLFLIGYPKVAILLRWQSWFWFAILPLPLVSSSFILSFFCWLTWLIQCFRSSWDYCCVCNCEQQQSQGGRIEEADAECKRGWGRMRRSWNARILEHEPCHEGDETEEVGKGSLHYWHGVSFCSFYWLLFLLTFLLLVHLLSYSWPSLSPQFLYSTAINID